MLTLRAQNKITKRSTRTKAMNDEYLADLGITNKPDDGADQTFRYYRFFRLGLGGVKLVGLPVRIAVTP